MSDDFDGATTPSNDNDFWLKASEPSLEAIWDNCEDEVYAELLEPDKCRKESYELVMQRLRPRIRR